MKANAFGLALLFVISSSALAADRDLASKLVATMRYEDVVVSSVQDCVDRARTTDVAGLVAKSPDLFGGIAPGSRLWQAASSAYINMSVKNCQAFSKERAMAAVGRTLADQLTNAEIEHILAFYETPAGRRFIFAAAMGNNAANREAFDEALSKAAGEEYATDMDRLVREHLELSLTPASDGSR